MARHVIAATPETTIRQAANLMRGRAESALPILAGEKLAGIVTVSDLLDVLGRGVDRSTPKPRATWRGAVSDRRPRTPTHAGIPSAELSGTAGHVAPGENACSRPFSSRAISAIRRSARLPARASWRGSWTRRFICFTWSSILRRSPGPPRRSRCCLAICISVWQEEARRDLLLALPADERDSVIIATPVGSPYAQIIGVREATPGRLDRVGDARPGRPRACDSGQRRRAGRTKGPRAVLTIR